MRYVCPLFCDAGIAIMVESTNAGSVKAWFGRARLFGVFKV
jgi:hypothetical protein